MERDPLGAHREHAERFRAEAQRLEARANRISLGRLITFLVAAVLLSAAVARSSVALAVTGTLALLLFFGLVYLHARVLQRRDGAEARRDVHRRHIARVCGSWPSELEARGREWVDANHPYAADIDLVGEGSLVQRIDVSRTAPGRRTLVRWLGGPAASETVIARQHAVAELESRAELRQELEAEAALAAGDAPLDPSPFLQLTRRTPYLDGTRSWVGLIHLLPPLTLGLWIAGSVGWVPGTAWLLALAVQIGVLLRTGGVAREAFDLVAARRGYVEALHRMLVLVERTPFDAEALRARQRRLMIRARPPSHWLRRLDRWAGLAELRHQFPVHLVANVFLLWDLHVLLRLERWSRDVGPHAQDVFEALGEVEALSSLATLAAVDSGTSFPELGAPDTDFEVHELAHPLLPAASRVANDLSLGGPGTVMVVTGSNMAGKSTLLRAVGLNVALALAGGPVVACRMRVPPVRLRASMRIDDSLQAGASYFHAELTKLRRVVDTAAERPPLFFLLDEVLRGTNAQARHLGARAVLVHLVERGAMGLVATHDVALAALEDEYPQRVSNAHFTDVMRDGTMAFDYRLRPGVVETSNALRLLEQAGIHVPEADREAAARHGGPTPGTTSGGPRPESSEAGPSDPPGGSSASGKGGQPPERSVTKEDSGPLRGSSSPESGWSP